MFLLVGAGALFLPLNNETNYAYHPVSAICTGSESTLQQCQVSTSNLVHQRCANLVTYPSVQCQGICKVLII